MISAFSMPGIRIKIFAKEEECVTLEKAGGLRGPQKVPFQV
jgi:hypothetical protein